MLVRLPIAMMCTLVSERKRRVPLEAALAKKNNEQMTEFRTLMKLYNEESPDQNAWKQKGGGKKANAKAKAEAKPSGGGKGGGGGGKPSGRGKNRGKKGKGKGRGK